MKIADKKKSHVNLSPYEIGYLYAYVKCTRLIGKEKTVDNSVIKNASNAIYAELSANIIGLDRREFVNGFIDGSQSALQSEMLVCDAT